MTARLLQLRRVARAVAAEAVERRQRQAKYRRRYASHGRYERKVNLNGSDFERNFAVGKPCEDDAYLWVFQRADLGGSAQVGRAFEAAASPGGRFYVLKRLVEYCNRKQKRKKVNENVAHKEEQRHERH